MEIASRELDSRLLLSVLALQRGYDVVLGQKWLMERNIRHMPPGVYVSKTLTKRDGQFMSVAKKQGYCVVSIDEEMPGLIAENDALRWISPDALSLADLVFLNGVPNRDAVVERFPETGQRVKAAGNPRWDMLRPELRAYYRHEADDIRRRHGRFVLINTNLGWTNSEKGPAEVMIADQVRLGKLNLQEPKDKSFVDEVLAMEAANKAALITTIASLAQRHPQVGFILRPHPSERLDSWEKSLSLIPNAKVIRDGAAAAWIMAAEVLLHTNCTTGVEAIALNKPALCLLTSETPLTARYLANRVNPIVRTAEEAVQALDLFLSGADNIRYTDEMQREFVRSMSAEPHRLGARVILDYIDEWQTRHGAAAAMRGEAWFPKVGYRWLQRDKSVRGILLPDLSTKVVAAKIGEIARELGISIPLNVLRVGSKVVLLSQQPASRRMRFAAASRAALARVWA